MTLHRYYEERRFWRKVQKNESGCWLWLGVVNRGGYGRIRYRGRNTTAHRASWAMHFGEFPPSTVCVCHSCDNPRCVNPAHLWCGTHADNQHDKHNKGRQRFAYGDANGSRRHPEVFPRGEAHKWSRISRDTAAQIAARYQAGGISQRAVAKLFGVSQTKVGLIVSGKSWQCR